MTPSWRRTTRIGWKPQLEVAVIRRAPVQDGFTAHSALTDDDWPALRAIAPDLRALGYDATMPDLPE
jgi:hypothetical protein